jgi:hypothetical protein
MVGRLLYEEDDRGVNWLGWGSWMGWKSFRMHSANGNNRTIKTMKCIIPFPVAKLVYLGIAVILKMCLPVVWHFLKHGVLRVLQAELNGDNIGSTN